MLFWHVATAHSVFVNDKPVFYRFLVFYISIYDQVV